ncbi:vascular endothelial growth factor receptor 3 isoform X2 [Protopterus annectens]|uniref:vascular endothelial growth factor receptor 3 isoform X2 n=1 Tax=Protopterus annectens TaxID=7888 RepID=UPI001CF992A0|nr:vascular endothelial growth factor receptor 3 isoform X2 [Protopterus annectens]
MGNLEMKMLFVPFLWIWHGITYNSDVVCGYSVAPPTLSIDTDDYAINVNETLNITCRGQHVLDWMWPSKLEFQEHETKGEEAIMTVNNNSTRMVTLTECEGTRIKPYCKTLTVVGTYANDTGLYRCFYKYISAIIDGTTAASTYVFVKDFDEPFAHRQGIGVVYVSKQEYAEVPCIVSIPDLNVTLIMMQSDKEQPQVLIPDGSTVVWNNKKGMQVQNVLIRYANIIYCQAVTKEKQYQSPIFFVHVTGNYIYDISISPINSVELMIGEKLTLNCTVTAEFNTAVHFKWNFPGQQVNSTVLITSERRPLLLNTELSSMLIIPNVTRDDLGKYVCSASNGIETYEISTEVMVHDKPFISVDYSKESSVVEATAGDKQVKLVISYLAYPQPDIYWYKDGKPIASNMVMIQRRKPSQASLAIHDISEQHAGTYMLLLKNPAAQLEQWVNLHLLVNVPPQIQEKRVAYPTNIYPRGIRQELICTVYGIPAAEKIFWHWKPWAACKQSSRRSLYSRKLARRRQREEMPECKDWKDVTSDAGPNKFESIDTWTEIVDGRNKTVSRLVIQEANSSVVYKCSAFNKVGRDEWLIYFYVTTIPEGFLIKLYPSEEPIEGQNVTLTCNADMFKYVNLQWYYLNPEKLQDEDNDTLTLDCKSIYKYADNMRKQSLSYQESNNASLLLRFPKITLEEEGNYVCVVQNKRTGEKHCHIKYVSVQAQEAPALLQNLTDRIVNITESMIIYCRVAGIPIPEIHWFKDKKPLQTRSGISLSDSNQTLTVQRMREEDSGVYQCFACNNKGCVNSSATVSVAGNEERTSVEIVILIGTAIIAVFFWVLLILIFCNIKRSNHADIKTGYLSIIMDPDAVPLEDQCEYLAYDSSRWEFPQDRLQLGKVLGHGAFGKVVEASAFGITKSNTCETVAVKMLKDGATASEQKALMSELKILIHIGNHLNVVNLLGACTRSNGPLMVIVEFCKYGNLSNYLRTKREGFIPYRERSPKSTSQLCSMVEAVMADRSRMGISEGIIMARMLTNRHQNIQWEMQEVDDLWKRPLTVEDLICYSFQVARGMEFLASRKCIHRDLAARNILLSDNNVVKICDFGLARDIYKDPDYVRKGNARLPLKWMAPESIFDKVYTTQSDVWSFGVLLWEIFSLGASPYPGVQINEEFCQRLKEGTRMRAPEYAPAEIYRIMLSCWHGNPKQRPLFSDLVEKLGDLLQASVQQVGKYYIPLSSSQSSSDDGFSQTISSTPHSDEEFEMRLCGDSLSRRYYNCVPFHGGYLTGGNQSQCPGRIQTFEELLVEHSTHKAPTDNQTDSGMVLASEELTRIENSKRRKEGGFSTHTTSDTDVVSEHKDQTGRCQQSPAAGEILLNRENEEVKEHSGKKMDAVHSPPSSVTDKC